MAIKTFESFSEDRTYMQVGNFVKVTNEDSPLFKRIGFIIKRDHDFVEVDFGTEIKTVNVSSLFDLSIK